MKKITILLHGFILYLPSSKWEVNETELNEVKIIWNLACRLQRTKAQNWNVTITRIADIWNEDAKAITAMRVTTRRAL
jgi:hypothetical protein